MAKTGRTFDERQYMRNGGYEAFHYSDSYLREVALHHHDFYEMYFFVSGGVRYAVESRSYQLSPGDVLLISPNELHQPLLLDNIIQYERIVIWISPNYFDNRSSRYNCDLTAAFDPNRRNHTNLLRPPLAVRRKLFALASEVVGEDPPGEYAKLQSELALLGLLCEVNAAVKTQTSGYEYADSFEVTLASIVDYINENLDKPLSLDGLAARFYISKYHLAHEFKRRMGTSAYRYITQRRLIKSRELLGAGNAPHDVIRPCGFADYSAFYRAFVSEYGLSPGEFRKISLKK